MAAGLCADLRRPSHPNGCPTNQRPPPKPMSPPSRVFFMDTMPARHDKGKMAQTGQAPPRFRRDPAGFRRKSRLHGRSFRAFSAKTCENRRSIARYRGKLVAFVSAFATNGGCLDPVTSLWRPFGAVPPFVDSLRAINGFSGNCRRPATSDANRPAIRGGHIPAELWHLRHQWARALTRRRARRSVACKTGGAGEYPVRHV